MTISNFRSQDGGEGAKLPFRALTVRRAVILAREREDALRRLADDYGTPAMDALADLLNFTLDEDAAVARRVHHVKRRAAA